MFHAPRCSPLLRECMGLRELAASRTRRFHFELTALLKFQNNVTKEIGYQLVTSLPVASRQEVTKQTHIPWCLPARSPAAERSAKPQTVKITTRRTLYLPYQALSLPIIPARRDECNCSPARVESVALFCPIPQRLAEPRRHADREAGYGSTGAFSANSLSIVLGGLVCS